MPVAAMRYARSVIALGGVILALSFWNWSSARPIFFAIYFGLSIAASMLKFRLPKIEGTYSVNFLFTLIGIAEFSLPETLDFNPRQKTMELGQRTANDLETTDGSINDPAILGYLQQLAGRLATTA